MPDTVSLPTKEILIRPRKGWQAIPAKELWEFRDLLWIFSLRDIKVRYRQAVLGLLWALLQPLTQVVVFTIFFGKLLGLEDRIEPVGGLVPPYAVFAMIGTVLWNFFRDVVTASSNSMLQNADILRKIYFPRIIIPLSAVGTPLIDLLVGVAALLVVMLYYGVALSSALLALPLLILVTAVASLGVGMLISALIVSYRDFKFVVPFMVTTWFFITPVIFEPSLFQSDFIKPYLWIVNLNPMWGLIIAARAIVLGHAMSAEMYQALAISTASSLALFVVGLFYFLRVERIFADIA